MDELIPINLGHIMYLGDDGTIKFSIAFDKWIFDYLYIDINNDKIEIK